MAKQSKATQGKGSNKATGKGKATSQPTAQQPAAQPTAVAVVPPKGQKYTGAALPAGVVAPQGYTPTARAVAAAQARTATNGGQPVRVAQYGLVRTKACPWGPNPMLVLHTLASLPNGQGTNGQVVLQAAALVAKGKLPAGCVGHSTPTSQWARHYSYHLQPQGLVAVTPAGNGYVYAITAAGRKALASGTAPATP